jgi:hypothetical protein
MKTIVAIALLIFATGCATTLSATKQNDQVYFQASTSLTPEQEEKLNALINFLETADLIDSSTTIELELKGE